MPEMDNRFMGPFTRMDAGGRLCRVTLTEIENSNDNSTPTPTISEGLDILRFQNLHERLAHRSPVAMRKTASEAGIEWPSAFDDIVNRVLWICPTCQVATMRTPNRLPLREEAKATRPFQRTRHAHPRPRQLLSLPSRIVMALRYTHYA